MTSVVDTSVKHFHSKMAGAAVLSGTAGALIAVLDTYLVNGADVKSATSLVVADGVATLSFSGSHSAVVDTVVLVSGSSISDLNGEQRVTATGTGVVKFATAAANATATGTISFKIAAAGWSKVFSGTNLAVYKSTDPMGTGMYLRVDDTGTTSCRVVGYEQMTDISTGTGPFPTAAQMSGGGYWPKSSLASAAAVSWVLVADGRQFIFHIAPYTATNAGYAGGITRLFGDGMATRPGGDPYACSLSYSSSATLGEQSDGAIDTGADLKHAMPRNYTGLGSSALHCSIPFIGTSVVSGIDPALGPFPSPVDGSMRLSRRYLATGTGVAPRCEVPGVYSVPMTLVYQSFKTLDKIPGTGQLAGRKLLALNPSGAYTGDPVAATTGVSFIDITGPWR